MTEEEMRKLKKGDLVVCVKDYKDQFTRGKLYRVRRINESSILPVMEDDNGVPNGWNSKFFVSINSEYLDPEERELLNLLYG